MSITDGHQAIIRRIVTMATSAAIALPNGPSKSLPRYVVQAAGGAQTSADMTGTTRAFPEVVVRVETHAGQYATEADAMVKALVQRFPVGAVFDGVKIDTAPDVRPALPGDGAFAVPVIIRGSTLF